MICFQKPLLSSFFYYHLLSTNNIRDEITSFGRKNTYGLTCNNTNLMLAKRYFVVKGKRGKRRRLGGKM
jgi:hypothetical protein